jgi:Tfp pilus assembly protein PilV
MLFPCSSPSYSNPRIAGWRASNPFECETRWTRKPCSQSSERSEQGNCARKFHSLSSSFAKRLRRHLEFVGILLDVCAPFLDKRRDSRVAEAAVEYREAGVTLIEVMASLCILLVVLSVMVAGFFSNLHSNMNVQIRYEAIQAAQSVIDQLRFQNLSGSTDPLQTSVAVGTRTYNVNVTYCGVSTYCSDQLRYLNVGVSYRSNQIYSTDTVFAKFY